MRAKGMAPNIALKSTYQLLDNSVNVQATILSYMDVFLYIGCMFLACVPFVLLFIKRAKRPVKLADAAH
jgi:DHA2 family multidrug resistance protein